MCTARSLGRSSESLSGLSLLFGSATAGNATLVPSSEIGAFASARTDMSAGTICVTARDSVHAGRFKLDLKTDAPVASDGAFFRISVEDSGHGISKVNSSAHLL